MGADLEEMEMLARDADKVTPSPWRIGNICKGQVYDWRGTIVAEPGDYAEAHATAKFIARCDPATILAMVSRARRSDLLADETGQLRTRIAELEAVVERVRAIAQAEVAAHGCFSERYRLATAVLIALPAKEGG